MPSIGMLLLRKSPLPGPSLVDASATLAPPETLSTSKAAPATLRREPSAKPYAAIGHDVSMPAAKRTNSAQKIGIEELRKHAANFSQHWDCDSKVYRCPACSSERKYATTYKAWRHLVHHFGDVALFPFLCPSENCEVASLEQSNIKRHVENYHKLTWTDERAASSVHVENKARLDALLRDIPTDGTLPRRVSLPGPSSVAASATLARSENPSSSKGARATSKGARVLCDDGAPPPKVRRQAAQVVSGDNVAGFPLKDEQVPLSTKREYAEAPSSGGATRLTPPPKSAPFAYLTNQQMPSHTATSRPKRSATKSLLQQVSDSASEEDDSSSSEFDPVAVVTSAGTSGPPTGYDGTPIDSALVTVFNCEPPSIQCLGGLCPVLKLFHQLNDTELKKFMELDKLNSTDELMSSCFFCGAKPTKTKEHTGGASGLLDHFFDTRTFYECTWPGCSESYANFDRLLCHYSTAHDTSLCRYKCDKCNYLATSLERLEHHERQPHPKTKSDALKTRSRNTHGVVVPWEDPKFCPECGIWYPHFYWTSHETHHKNQKRTFDSTLPVRGVQITGLRDGKCPFDDCNEPYRDFIGWYLHCTSKHSAYITSGYVPITLHDEKRLRMPSFRCTSCYACIPIGQVERHRAKCPIRILPETVGQLMQQRAAAYGDKPDLLILEYGGHRVIQERQLTGILREATVSATQPHWIGSILRAIRKDPFLHSFVERNAHASQRSGVYTVARIRQGIVPDLGELIKERTIYVGSSTDIGSRAFYHIRNSLTQWAYAGLKLEDDEELYIFRMTIVIDEATFAGSFNKADLKRLEQLLIDALGMGTLYNAAPALGCETQWNDPTYRNHIAPRLNQLALVLFKSTHTQLKKNGIVADNGNVWHLPITRTELNNLLRKVPFAGVDKDAEPTRVDQACSPIPDVRISSPDLREAISRFRRQEGLKSDEDVLARLRASTVSDTSSRLAEAVETNEPLWPASKSVQSVPPVQRPDSSLDMFAYLYETEEDKESMPTDCDPFDFDHVPSKSNGADYRALDELRATCTATTTSLREERQESDESHVPAGESVQFDLHVQRSAASPGASESLQRCEASASASAPLKKSFDFVPPPVLGKRILRIGRYGGRSTQCVNLDAEPRDLSQDSSSEASVDEPSPTDSGFFDFSNIPGNGSGPDPHIEDSDDQTATMKSAIKAKVASAKDDDKEEGEADSGTYDTCAHKNCRRPQHENINWAQCDDCDNWYHSLCILGVEKPFEQDEFQCGCAKNGKQTPGQMQEQNKRKAL